MSIFKPKKTTSHGSNPAFETLEQRTLLSTTLISQPLIDAWNAAHPPTNASVHHPHHSPVEIVMSLNKSVYHQGEPILLTFTIRNHSKKTVHVKDDFATPFDDFPTFQTDVFRLTRNDGKQARYAGLLAGDVMMPNENDLGGYITVQPAHKVQVTLDLSKGYTDLPAQNQNPPSLTQANGLSAGRWTVTYTGSHRYTTKQLHALPAWKSFHAVKPEDMPIFYSVTIGKAAKFTVTQ